MWTNGGWMNSSPQTSTKPGSQTSTKPGPQTSTKPGPQTSTKPGPQTSTKPGLRTDLSSMKRRPNAPIFQKQDSIYLYSFQMW